MSAPNKFGDNRSQASIVYPIDEDGNPLGPSNPLPVDITTGGAAVSATNPLPVTLDAHIGGATFTDGSPLTITTGGASQQVFAANTARVYLFVINTSDTIMYLGIGAAATATGIPLAAGGGFYEPLVAPGQSINILCATTGKTFVAKSA
jgi:hypothetical protein